MRRLELALSLCLLVGAAPPPASAQGVAQPPLPAVKPCSLELLLSELRAALRSGSPAFRRYAAAQLKESALSVPAEQLRAAFLAERDPAVIEALGQTLAARSSRTTHAAHVKAVIARAQAELGRQRHRRAHVRLVRGAAGRREVGSGNVGIEGRRVRMHGLRRARSSRWCSVTRAVDSKFVTRSCMHL